MNIDFTTISLSNLITIAVAAIAILIVLKKTGITKIGSLEIEREHEGLTTNALVLKRLDDIDIKLHDNVSITTNQMMRQFLPQGDNLCYYARRAITECVLIPLRKRAACNHFTTHLSGADNRDVYKQMIMDSIKDQYADVRPINSKLVCENEPGVPRWVDVELFYSQLVDEWIRRVSLLTKEACEEKVSVYTEAIASVKNDKYWVKVFTECRDKNLKYIREIV